MLSITMKRLAPLAAVAALALLAFTLGACASDSEDANAGDSSGDTTTPDELRVENAYVRSSSDELGAAYFTIIGGTEDDRLLSVTASGVGSASLHETITEGISGKMVPIEGGVEIPASETVAFEPGARHVMLMDLAQPLEVGDIVALHLEFEEAGTLDIEAPVEDYAPGGS